MSFSLVRGGFLYLLERRLGLLTSRSLGIGRRILAFVCVTWVPILALDFAARGGAVSDLGMNIRFLFSGPLLIAAEALVETRALAAVRQFEARGLIERAEPFEGILARVNRQISGFSAFVAEAAFLGLVVSGAVLEFGPHGSAPIRDLSVSVDASGIPLALRWYAWIGLPLLQFLQLRWAWRFSVWIRFLWKVSRLKIMLRATHPDQAGGLGFLSLAQEAFAPIWLAVSAHSATVVAFRMSRLQRPIESFYLPIAALVACETLLLLVPLAFFLPRLAIARREGLLNYGQLSSEYVRGFERKWIETGSEQGLLGSPDFQSLADLGNGFDRVRRMRVLPIEPFSLLVIVLFALLPFLPLGLLVLPLEQILKAMIRLLA